MATLAFPVHQVSASPSESDPAPVSEDQRALTEAKQSGQRVEVTGKRSERSTVFANPDGHTFTLEESTAPVRVPAPDGGWQAPDATLEKRPDGSVAPKAAAVQMAFSGGGDKAPLARITDHGRSLELGWPGTLPAPTLDGTTASYAEVLPGVDLRVNTTPESFQPVFVVKTPEAAANKELKKLTFDLKAVNLNVREGASGSLAAVDDAGRTVFKAPPARMWDSAGEDAGPQTQLARTEAAGTGEAAPSDPSESAPSGSGVEPGQGDAVTRMDVDVTKDSLSVVPDAQMLSETDAADFPLFIDPAVAAGVSERTLLRSDGYTSYGWSNGSDNEGKGMGHCSSYGGYYCGPGYTQRLYFEFSPSQLSGKKVLDATFRATETWSFTCDAKWVDLVRTNNISSSTTWSSRPAELDWMVDRWVSAGRGSACDPSQPAAPIEFHDNPAESNENLTPTVQSFAAGNFARLTLELRAHDESDTAAWKRFRNDAILSVQYVSLPAKPSDLHVVDGGASACIRSASDPQIVSDVAPQLKATAHTMPGGATGQENLRVYFDLDELHSDGTWVDTTPPGGVSAYPTTGFRKDGQAISMTWSGLAVGTLYRYHAWTWSYYDDQSNHLSSAASDGFCYFKVDPPAPKAPKITINSVYTDCDKDCTAHGGPGVPGEFVFAPGDGDVDIKAYQYKLSAADGTWSDDDWSSELPGLTVSRSIPPTRSGANVLSVRAKDDSKWGALATIEFNVAEGPGPVGLWHFDEATGAALDAETTDGEDNATLHGGASRDDRGRLGEITRDAQNNIMEESHLDKGMALDGTTGYAATDGQVVDTSDSYTVSAWARLDRLPSDNRTVLGQDGTFYSGFYLSYQGSVGTWTLRTSPKDDGSGNITDQVVVAKQPATAGVWTHLAAVYDKPANEIRLYVNGKLQGSHTAAPSWKAQGPLQIGRVLWAGAYYDYFPGSIDEVAVWQSALTSDQIAEGAQQAINGKFNAVELVGAWSADGGTGSGIGDTSGYGRPLTLAGGAAQDGEAITLDGVDDAATASGPVVDDTGSFSVTALASVNGADLLSKPTGYTGQVVGQQAADGSSWGIWYKKTGTKPEIDPETFEEKTVPLGRWYFGRLNADGTFSAVGTPESEVTDAMVRLTGVFDAQDGTIRLYQGKSSDEDPKAFTATVGSGDLAVGKGFTGGSWQHYLTGRVAEVRLWAGAMETAEQVGEAVGT
ncbi:laminin G domain-containing protein [Streptomyces actuosus]|uniref:Laminin G domain-containing protein n=2 Tax=Streptomyces actuosus TaxID=1885 RepID=A0ABS2VQ31_STRAS|nr:laminin G domain-containing protein [Streptomyces actuosus]